MSGDGASSASRNASPVRRLVAPDIQIERTRWMASSEVGYSRNSGSKTSSWKRVAEDRGGSEPAVERGGRGQWEEWVEIFEGGACVGRWRRRLGGHQEMRSQCSNWVRQLPEKGTQKWVRSQQEARDEKSGGGFTCSANAAGSISRTTCAPRPSAACPTASDFSFDSRTRGR